MSALPGCRAVPRFATWVLDQRLVLVVEPRHFHNVARRLSSRATTHRSPARRHATFGLEFAGEHSGRCFFAENRCSGSGVLAAVVLVEGLSGVGVPLSGLGCRYDRCGGSGEVNFMVDDPGAVVEAWRAAARIASTGWRWIAASGGSICGPRALGCCCACIWGPAAPLGALAVLSKFAGPLSAGRDLGVGGRGEGPAHRLEGCAGSRMCSWAMVPVLILGPCGSVGVGAGSRRGAHDRAVRSGSVRQVGRRGPSA